MSHNCENEIENNMTPAHCRVCKKDMTTKEETALQSFANWIKDLPKDTKIKVSKSEKTIVFTIIK